MNLSINPNLFNKTSFKAEMPKNSDVTKQELKVETNSDSFDKKINDIETKTGIEHSKVPQKQETEIKPVEAASSQITEPQTIPAPKNSVGNFIEKVSKTSAIIKGLVQGSIAGVFFGTITAGTDMIYTGIKKIKNKEKGFKFYQIFNPKKALSKSGRNLSIAVALGCVIGEIVSPLVKSKKTNGQTVK